MKRFLICLFSFIAIEAYGYAPMVDKFNSLTRWLIPAYLYCLLFGIITLIGLIVISYLYKEKVNRFYIQLYNYIRTNTFLRVGMGGILLAIPLGLISGVLYRTIWFSSVVLIIPIMITFIFILSRFFLNKMFGCQTLKWFSFLSIAIFGGCIFFILGSIFGLPLTDQDYLDSGRNYIQLYYHPFDSLMHIWEFVPIFIMGVLFVELLVLFDKVIS